MWWRNLPLHLKLSLPIQLALLILLPVAHLLVMDKLESKMLEDVELRTQDSATQSLLALNSMMLTDTIRNQNARDAFLNRMSAQENVEDFHLVRSDLVDKQFGPGLAEERATDELDRAAAETKKVQTQLSHQGKHTLRMVVPFAAKKDYLGVNCLQCHHVSEGEVLGTISLKVNLEPEYRKIQQLSSVLLVGQIFLQLLLFFLIYWLILSVTGSVVELESVMLRVKEDEDFSRRAEVHGNDEIGQISQVFNGFVSHIEELHIKLDEKISALEAYYDQTEEELRIGSDIMSRITDAHSNVDPVVRLQIDPAAHYSGDIILVSRTPTDTLHIMLADAVGHGLIAAMNLLPISQIFNAMSKKGFNISRIAAELNSKIHRLMPVDRFIGAALVSIDFRNRVVEVWNGGVPAPILVSLDGTILHKWQSRNLPLGILDEKSFASEVEVAQYNDDCQLFVFSDGLPEAESPDGLQFGMERITQLLQSTEPDLRFDKLMSSMEHHLGSHRAHDDVSLAMANISIADVQELPAHHLTALHEDVASNSHWRIALSLGKDELQYLDAVSLVAQIISKIHPTAEHYSPLFVILSELFNNALDHGILKLDSAVKQGPDGFEEYLHQRDARLHSLSSGSIDIEVEKMMIEGNYGVKIRVVDSGEGFDYSAVQGASLEEVTQRQHGRGIALANSLAHKVVFSGKGNDVTAYYVCTRDAA